MICDDLGSFMRDILLTRFFEDKDVTRNRYPGTIIVDEVDSLTLKCPLHVAQHPRKIRLTESSDIADKIRQLIEPTI